MSKEEIKYEINQVLDRLSDKSLEELLSFLKGIQTGSLAFFNPASLRKILYEDEQLLQKLAQ
jgi:hypothetical protein